MVSASVSSFIFYGCFYFLFVLIVTFIVLLVCWYYKFFKYYPYFLKFNGIQPLPIIGSAYKVRSTSDVIPTLMDLHKNYGSVMKVWIGFNPRIIISDYRAAELLLGSPTLLDKSMDYTFFHAWLGTGLLTSSGAKWKRQRKLLTPAFHFQILEQFINVFNAQSEILVKQMLNVVDKSSVDIHPFVNLCALDIISESAMGIQLKAQTDINSEYVHSVSELTKIILGRSVSAVKSFDFLYKFTNDYRKEKKAISILHRMTNFVIKTRTEILLKNEEKVPDENEFGIKKRLTFLDLLLQCRVDGEPLSIESVREEVDTFMFEGHDTITAGISFCLYCLSKNRNVQERAVEELQTIFGNDQESSPSYQDLQDMKYLEMVIKEAMRLYPPVPIFAREVTEDVEFDGVTVPKGVCLTLFSYGLHRQEEIYPDPEEFDPERFSAENTRLRPPFAHVPFSAGPRNCIGQRFAMLEMKSVISKILRNYELLPVPGYKPELATDGILRSNNGVLIRIKKREH